MRRHFWVVIFLIAGCAWGQDIGPIWWMEGKQAEVDRKKDEAFVRELRTKLGWNGALIAVFPGPLPKPEPMDVPAIQRTCVIHSKEITNCEPWTCADKRRILLISEDGEAHCIKFPKEQP